MTSYDDAELDIIEEAELEAIRLVRLVQEGKDDRQSLDAALHEFMKKHSADGLGTLVTVMARRLQAMSIAVADSRELGFEDFLDEWEKQIESGEDPNS